MNAVFGLLFLGSGVLLFCWATIQHRRPRPPAWLPSDMASISLCLTVLTLLFVGAVFVAHAVADLGGIGAPHLLLLLIEAALLAVGLSACRKFWRNVRGEPVVRAGQPPLQAPKAAG